MKKEQKERKAALAKAATQEKGTTKSAIGEAFWSWGRLVPVLFFPTFDEFKVHMLNDAIDFARPFIIQNFTEMAGVVNTKDAKTAQSTFRMQLPAAPAAKTREKAQCAAPPALGAMVGPMMLTVVPDRVRLDPPPSVSQGRMPNMCSVNFEHMCIGSVRFQATGQRDLLLAAYDDAWAWHNEIEHLAEDINPPSTKNTPVQMMQRFFGLNLPAEGFQIIEKQGGTLFKA